MSCKSFFFFRSQITFSSKPIFIKHLYRNLKERIKKIFSQNQKSKIDEILQTPEHSSKVLHELPTTTESPSILISENPELNNDWIYI